MLTTNGRNRNATLQINVKEMFYYSKRHKITLQVRKFPDAVIAITGVRHDNGRARIIRKITYNSSECDHSCEITKQTIMKVAM